MATALIGTGVPLGIVPAGSGNALARALRIPLDVGRAISGLNDFSRRVIDVGRINGYRFLSTAGIGLDADVIDRHRRLAGPRSGANTAVQLPWHRRGMISYAAAALSSLGSCDPEELTIEVDGSGDPIRGRFGLATIANTAHFGYGLTIAPGAVPDDGQLDLCLVEKVSPSWILRNGIRLLRSAIDRASGVSIRRCRHLRIQRSGPGLLQTDGEARTAAALLEIDLDPGALLVAIPRHTG